MPLYVAFLWHMHQPLYVDPVSQTALLPWVRLHATKGYLDMIWQLEQHPDFRCTFNLTPVLLQQLEAHAAGKVRDVIHDLARTPAEELSSQQRQDLLVHFFKANWPHMIKPYPRYWALLQKRGAQLDFTTLPQIAAGFSSRELRDLQVWYLLTWFGYAASHLYPEIAELKRRGRDFTEADKQFVLDRQTAILRDLIPRYRAAQERGQIEISTTPFYHPILPLIYNTEFSRRCESLPSTLPQYGYPEDVRAQIELAANYVERLFGQRPVGLWPSEGSVCPELVPHVAAAGFEWMATDEEILWRSRAAEGPPASRSDLYQLHQLDTCGGSVTMVFRDRTISDFIGFMAARNDPRTAADHVIEKLHSASQQAGRRLSFCAVILDGENAWEHFPDGGEAFLHHLYTKLSNTTELRPATMRACRAAIEHRAPLRQLHTGSWINANFHIWIAHPEDRQGWTLLARTRSDLERCQRDALITPAQYEAAMQEIYAAEGSDWFWWYGDDFVTEDDATFDRLFRLHLQNVYRLSGQPVPAWLETPIRRVSVATVITPPIDHLTPVVDGRLTTFYEWTGAGRYEARQRSGTMHQGQQWLETMHFGFDHEQLYLRFDLAPGQKLPNGDPLIVRVTFTEPTAAELTLKFTPNRAGPVRCQGLNGVTAAVDRFLEAAIPFAAQGWQMPVRLRFVVRVASGELELERHPVEGSIPLEITDAPLDMIHWSV